MTFDFSNAIAQSETLYDQYSLQGQEYLDSINFEKILENSEIAAEKAGQMNVWNDFCYIGMQTTKVVGNAVVGMIGAIVSTNDSLLGAGIGAVGGDFVSKVTDLQYAYIHDINGKFADNAKLNEQIVSASALGYFTHLYNHAGANTNNAELPNLIALEATFRNNNMKRFIVTPHDREQYRTMSSEVKNQILNVKLDQLAKNQVMIEGLINNLNENDQQRAQLIIQTLLDSHDESMAFYEDLWDISSQNSEDIKRIMAKLKDLDNDYKDLATAVKNIPAEVKAMLKELGVDLKSYFDSRFNVLLAYDQASVLMLGELIAYKRAQEKEQKEMAKQKTIYRGFSFIATIGSQFGIKALYQSAVVSSASYTIYKSVDSLIATFENFNNMKSQIGDVTKLITNFDKFIMCMDPVLAIGEAILTVVKLFQNTESIEQTILKQLQKILMTLAGISQQLEKISQSLHQYLNYLLDQMRLLFSYNFFLTRTAIINIEKLQSSFLTMLNLMELNFQSVFLNDLMMAVAYGEVYTQKDVVTLMPESEYFKTMGLFKHWILSVSKSPILTGGNLLKALNVSAFGDKHQNRLSIIANSFNAVLVSPDRMNYIINLFVRFSKELLNLYASNVDNNNIEPINDLINQVGTFEDILPNVEILRLALSAYTDLKLFYIANYHFDTDERNLLAVTEAVKKYLDYIYFCQTTSELIDSIENNLSHLIYKIKKAYENHTNNKLNVPYIFKTLTDCIAEINQQQKTVDFLAHETTVLMTAYADKSKVEITGNHQERADRFIDIISNYETCGLGKKKLFDILYKKGIRPSAIYVLALELGLGRFEVTFYESVHGTQGVEISMDGNRYGAEIYFHAINGNGLRYQISEATRAEHGCTWNMQHDNGPVLRNIFNQFLVPRTQFVTYQEAAFTKFVFDHLHGLKVRALKGFLEEIQEHQWYDQLECNLAYYILLMQIIGIPAELQQKIIKIINAYPNFRDYCHKLMDDATSFTIPQSTKGHLLNLQETESVRLTLITILQLTKTNSSFRKIYLDSPLLKQLYAVITVIYNYLFQLRQIFPNKTYLFERIGRLCAPFAEEVDIGLIQSGQLTEKKQIEFSTDTSSDLFRGVVYLYLSQTQTIMNVRYSYHNGVDDNRKIIIATGKLRNLQELGLDINFFNSNLSIDRTDVLFKNIIKLIIADQNKQYMEKFNKNLLKILCGNNQRQVANKEYESVLLLEEQLDETVCLSKEREAHLRAIGVMNVPKNYHVVFTANTNPFIVTEHNATITIPNYRTGNTYIPYFSGGTSKFNRIIFSSETLADPQFKLREPTNSLIQHEQTLETAGLFKIPAGYKVVFTENKVSNEITEINTVVKMTANGSSYSGRAGNVHINSQGTTAQFARCAFASGKAGEANVSHSDNESPALKAMRENGFFNIPKGYHVVAVSAAVAGLPLLKEESASVDCIASGNNPSYNIGITAHGKTEVFPRVILASAQISAPADDTKTSQIFVTKLPQEKVASTPKIQTELPEVFIPYNKTAVPPQIDKVEKLKLTHPVTTQQGWNCFDLAVGGLDRNAFISYAISHAQEEEFRQLLAPEIRHAAALTAIFMGMEEQDKEEKIKKILELFPVVAALKGTEDEEQVNKAIENIINTTNPLSTELRLQCLPQSMHTSALKKLINDYTNAHENMRAAVAQCNQSLGKREGSYLSLEALDKYFEERSNQRQHTRAYRIFSSKRRKIFTASEKALAAYCMNIETYNQYVNNYYGKKGWFAFQRSFKDEKAKTSMIDIAAKYLSRQIIIQQGSEELYRTAIYGTTLCVQYENNIHFSSSNVVADDIVEKTSSLIKQGSHFYRKEKSKTVGSNYARANVAAPQALFQPAPPLLPCLDVVLLQNELVTACECGNLKAVQDAIRKGAEPFTPNAQGKYPLAAAVWGVNPNVINYLLSLKTAETKLMSWEEIVQQNKLNYQKTFNVTASGANNYDAWIIEINNIEENVFLRDLCLEAYNEYSLAKPPTRPPVKPHQQNKANYTWEEFLTRAKKLFTYDAHKPNVGPDANSYPFLSTLYEFNQKCKKHHVLIQATIVEAVKSQKNLSAVVKMG